jgi:hypothetical protein
MRIGWSRKATAAHDNHRQSKVRRWGQGQTIILAGNYYSSRPRPKHKDKDGRLGALLYRDILQSREEKRISQWESNKGVTRQTTERNEENKAKTEL